MMYAYVIMKTKMNEMLYIFKYTVHACTRLYVRVHKQLCTRYYAA